MYSEGFFGQFGATADAARLWAIERWRGGSDVSGAQRGRGEWKAFSGCVSRAGVEVKGIEQQASTGFHPGKQIKKKSRMNYYSKNNDCAFRTCLITFESMMLRSDAFGFHSPKYSGKTLLQVLRSDVW